MKLFTYQQQLGIINLRLILAVFVLSFFQFTDLSAQTPQCLSGTYTVDSNRPASPRNFQSLDSLTKVLNQIGVCGPTTINVATGTYTNDPIYLKKIPGASHINNIVIDGGDSSKVFVTEDGNKRFAALTFDGTHNVHVKNMTFKMTDWNSGDAVLFVGAVKHDTLSSCVTWINPALPSPAGLFNISFSSDAQSNTPGAAANYIVVRNNWIIGGRYGIYAVGSSSTLHHNLQFYNNSIDSVFGTGANIDYQDSLEFVGNSINMLNNNNPGAGGVAFNKVSNLLFSANYIKNNNGMAFVYMQNDAATSTKRNEISNNMIYSSGGYGIYFFMVDSVDFWHNSINTEGSANSAVNLRRSKSYDFRNNIFSSNKTAVLETDSPDSTMFIALDYNLYNVYNGSTLLKINGVSYADLATYVAAQSAFNANSIESDPEFFSSSDLHISGSAANEVGDNSVGITVDIDGDVRPSPRAS
ncbi:MAG TPA: right-handed parallel beta-helix repeat-containing protein, partial [Marinilabiliaceae bacterium]|nr:right-handed parallel beta-helix repeat-containing protein [Marinilabiliaceae bacterium]